MTIEEIAKGFEATIDQFYGSHHGAYLKECQLNYIGGILQAALHILPNARYYKLKEYIFFKHGYDPGGVDYGQLGIEDLILNYDEDEEKDLLDRFAEFLITENENSKCEHNPEWFLNMAKKYRKGLSG